MNSLAGGAYTAILFDLDGTLVDTAPDMVAALQALQRAHRVEPVTYTIGRSFVSNGAIGLLRLGFPKADDRLIKELHHEYLEEYAGMLCNQSAIFDGLTSLLEVFDSNNIPWGVVTNKPQYLTDPLIAELGLAERLACCVSGDTLPQRKPDPAPLHHACEIAGMNVVETIYVGDAARDIEAGRAATMGTVAVAYGYITPDDSVAAWGADAIAADTQELAQILFKAVNVGS